MVGKHILRGSICVFVLVALFLSIACTPLIQKPGEESGAGQTAVEEKGEQSTTSPAEVPAKIEVTPPSAKPKITIVPPKEKPKPSYDPLVAGLMAKANEVGAYRYTYDASKAGTYDYYISGEKAKKVYLVPIKLKGDVNYNEVYLDDALQDAKVICSKGVSSCTFAWKKAYDIEYSTENVELTPLSIVAVIPYSAKKVGEELFDNQKTSIIEYVNAQERKERIWMDHYTGLPLKQVIYSVDDVDGDKELTKHTFTRVILNIKKSEVLFPASEYELQKE